MAKTKISEWSTTPSSNTDIDGINIAEGCAPSGINDAIRDMMAQIRSWQSGASGDPFNGPMNGTIGSTTAYAGAFTTLSASGTVTLSGGTANGVAYLNGSKVVTSGSALTFDGTKLTSSASGAISGVFNRNTSSGATLDIQVVGGSVGTLGSDSGGNGRFDIAAGTSLQLRATGGSGYISFDAANAEQMRLTSTGLGIGTSSPNYSLTSYKGGAVANYIQVASGSTGAGSGNGLLLGVDSSGNSVINAQGSGSGNMLFYTATAEKMRLDSSGNLGLGVTPSAWTTNYKAMQIGTAGISMMGGTSGIASFALYGQNFYYDGTTYKYITSNAAGYMNISNGGVAWYTAPSGTAGNAITFSQAMTLDASGNLLVGTTSQFQSSKLSVSGSGNVGDFRTSSASGYPVVCENTASGSTNMVIFLTGASTTTVGSITYNGSLTLYNTTSDQRLKENIQDSDSASNLIDSLKVRKFDWKESNVHQRYGFVAQELVTVAPEAVHQPADTNEMMAVDYSKLVPMLVKEIQSLRKRLADAGI